MDTKHCPKCGEDLPRDLFNRSSRTLDGLNGWCRPCSNASSREWARKNREKHNAQNRAWRAANPERTREIGRDGYYRNLERTRAHKLANQKKRLERLAAAAVEHVDRLVLLERDDGVCGICGDDVDPLDYHHVVALVNGGEHSYANTRVAHPLCNARKAAA